MLAQLGKLCARRVAQGRGYTVMKTRTCPSCGTGLPTALPVCPRCRYIGKVHESITHHELLGLPYRPNPFVVDARELKRRFLEAQRLCHPDGWAMGSARDKDAAQAVSNAVNRAYRTLLSPMERIAYVLGRNGEEVGEAEQVEDMGLMMEVMAAREAIEESDGVGLGRLKSVNDDGIRDVLVRIEKAVSVNDWVDAKRWAVRLKYLSGIEDAIQRRAENAE